MKRLFFVVILAILLLGLVQTVNAHPHVFVDPEITLVFSEHGLVGVRHQWSFDEMFTVFILQDYDLDADMRLDKGEVEALKAGAFDNIKQWHWFTYMTVDGKPFDVKAVSEFTAWIEGGALVYEFFVSCRVPLAVGLMSVSLFDPDYYVDFLPLVDESVQLSGDGTFVVSMSIAEEQGAISSKWMIAPTVVRVEFFVK